MTASEKQKTVILTFHHEDGSWWAESDQMPSLFAGGDDLDAAKELAQQAVVDEFGEDVVVVEWVPVPEPLAAIIATPNEMPASMGEQFVPPDIESWPEVPLRDFESDLRQAV